MRTPEFAAKHQQGRAKRFRSSNGQSLLTLRKFFLLTTPFIPASVYKLLFFLVAGVYLTGMFVPLMDNDAAHHANIALRMHLTGDYVNLVDHNGNYLDKPHLLFWLTAFSYKIFGVTSFAYKLPSLLFSVLGIYSTYRIGERLYNKETGKLAALVIATAFAFILSNSDVRMDAILTSCIAFSSWQLVAFVQDKKISTALLSGLGLALGFATKGHIAVFVPMMATLFYILFRKEYSLLWSWKWLAVLFSFLVFIFPVLYCFYQQYNLHPEKIVRGKDHINGLRFILFDQVIDRMAGRMEERPNRDHLFFFHTFLTAFAPWSVLAYFTLFERIRYFLSRKYEWATPGAILSLAIAVSLSGYQLPHYLNVVLPAASVMVASFIIDKQFSGKWAQAIFVTQMIVVLLILFASAFINAWSFPVRQTWVIIIVVLLLSCVFYFLKSKQYSILQKSILITASTMVFAFFLLNANFYPQLLKYQGGNELAFASKDEVNTDHVFFWKDTYSSSFNFYTRTMRKPFADSLLVVGQKNWLIYDIKDTSEIRAAGYTLKEKNFVAVDYEVTMLDLKFLDPSKREQVCTQMLLSEISRENKH